MKPTANRQEVCNTPPGWRWSLFTERATLGSPLLEKIGFLQKREDSKLQAKGSPFKNYLKKKKKLYIATNRQDFQAHMDMIQVLELSSYTEEEFQNSSLWKNNRHSEQTFEWSLGAIADSTKSCSDQKYTPNGPPTRLHTLLGSRVL